MDMRSYSIFYSTAEVLAAALKSDDEKIQLEDSGTSNDEDQADVLNGGGASLCLCYSR